MEYKKAKKEEYQHWPERVTMKKLAEQLKKLRESEHLYTSPKETD